MKRVGVVAFGHVHFVRACDQAGLRHPEVAHCRDALSILACDEIIIDSTAPARLRDLAIAKAVAIIEGVELSMHGESFTAHHPEGHGLVSYDPVNQRNQRQALAKKYGVSPLLTGADVCLAVIQKVAP